MSTHERQRALIDASLADSPVSIAFVDTDARLVWCNAAFATLTARSTADLEGHPIADLLPSHRPTAEDHVREVLQRGTSLFNVPLTAATAASAPNAPVRQLRATISPSRSPTGELLGVSVLCADVTDVMALVEQFWQSQKLEAVGRLANLVAHDFNNLLTVIHGYCDLLLRDSSDEVRRKARLEEIRSAAAAAGRLSHQLLTLSRRNTGAVGPVNLNLLVRTIGGMLDRILPANVTKAFDLGDELGLTLADPGQLEQILMNLITNAVDAMPAGGHLVVATANLALGADDAKRLGMSPGDFVSLSITDTGAGMDAATLARAFEPLFTTKTPDKGTGLGLPTVRTMVRQLHGDVTVVSAPGKGSTLTVLLPRVSEPRSARAAAAASVAASVATSTAPPGARPATILLVEDSEELRRALVVQMTIHGYSVIAVGSAADALRQAKGHDGPIDLLLSDVELPDGDGRELAGLICRARPGVRVLLASGFGEQAMPGDNAAHTRYPFISKPFTMSELVDTIQATLYPSAQGAD